MSCQDHLRAELVVLGLERVFRAIEDLCGCLRGHGGNDVWILRHVACFVDLSIVAHSLDDVEFELSFGLAVPTYFARLTVVFCKVGVPKVWHLYSCDLDIFVLRIRSVRSKEKTVFCEIGSFDPGNK